MKKIYSKVGIVFLFVYALFTLGILIYAFTCRGMCCGLVIVLPVMPWAIILEGFMRDTWLTYALLLILNGSILYGIGLALGKLKK